MGPKIINLFESHTQKLDKPYIYNNINWFSVYSFRTLFFANTHLVELSFIPGTHFW